MSRPGGGLSLAVTVLALLHLIAAVVLPAARDGCNSSGPAPGGRTRNGRPRLVRTVGRAGGRDGWRSVPPVAGAGQRGDQARPARPPVLAAGEGPGPGGYRGPRAAEPASPRVTGVGAAAHGRRAVLPGQAVGEPQVRVALLAGGAYQAADGIMAPPGGERAGPDVGLAERGRVVIPPDAAGHLAPDGGPPERIAQYGPFGDGNRPGECLLIRQLARCGAWCRRAREPARVGAGNRALPRGRPGVPGDDFRCHAGLPEVIPARPRGALGG